MISVCIITRNEAGMLKKCLEALSRYNLEIVVVDTGSDDDSRSVAAKYTDKVYEFKWCDDFSAARNYAAEKASNNMILALDTDEIIEQMDITAIDICSGKTVGRMMRINEYIRQGEQCRVRERISRLYDRRFYQYKGRIHEQISSMKPLENETVYRDIPVVVRHFGYDGSKEKIAAKAERNIRLLKLDIEENGDDPYVLYQLGKSYYMSVDFGSACEYFGRALSYDLEPELEYVQDMVETYGYALVNTGNATVAREILGSNDVYEAFSNWADFCFMMGLVYMNCEEYEKAIEQFMEAVKRPAHMEGTNSYKAYYNAGVILECLGRVSEAADYYRHCGDYEAARKRLAGLTGEKA